MAAFLQNHMSLAHAQAHHACCLVEQDMSVGAGM